MSHNSMVFCVKPKPHNNYIQIAIHLTSSLHLYASRHFAASSAKV